jgi:glycosyltransferase involved in cell wall biosynthesis
MMPAGKPLSGGMRSKGEPGRSSHRGPVISVVTVVYNGERHIDQAIRSVLSQSYDNIEYIVVDGGSTDRTLEIIRAHEDRIDCWVSEPDGGIYDAMNKGIGLASGDLVGLLNSDDWYADGAIAEIARIYADGGEERRVITGKWGIVLEPLGITIEATPSLRFHTGMPLCHQAMFVPKKVYASVGLYDLDYRFSADLDMALRLYSNRVPFVFSDKILVHFRASGASDQGYRESVREASGIIRKHLPYATYAAYRMVRWKFEFLTRASKFIERAFGRGAADQLKSAYYRAKARYSPTWKIH